MMPTHTARISVCTFLLTTLIAAFTPPAYAGSSSTVAKTVYAQVLKVVPLHRPVTQCSLEAKPSHSQGLVAQLRWDFDNQCRQDQPEIKSFRVTYTWDGRTYTEKLSYNPGKHIPLQVRYR